jgi:hypothetical protein
VSRLPEAVAVILLLVGLAGTAPPWHRSGTLTSAFSAWVPNPDPWPLVSCLAVIVAAAVAAGGLLLGPSRGITGGYAVLGAAAAGIAARTLLAAPDYFSPTPAPFVVFAASLGAAAVGAVRLRRIA